MEDRVTLSHGSGGRLSHELVENLLLPFLKNPILSDLEDSAIFDIPGGRLAFTTDSYVVNPIFFPGGDIGRLAVCGTVNDLSMMGAKPIYLGLSLIIEEGFPMDDLKRIMISIKEASEEAEVAIVTGDTKVVNRGKADGIFINTSGIGIVANGVNISASSARPGDRIILSGSIGDHGMAVLSKREGLDFTSSIKSDCSPLNKLVSEIIEATRKVHCLRDPTRGGLATTLNEFAMRSSVGIKIREDKIPVNEAVRAACEFLGIDPLYVANEGKLVAVIPSNEAENVLRVMRKNIYGLRAEIIGEVISEYPGKVILQTSLGPERIVPMMTGEILPRIC